MDIENTLDEIALDAVVAELFDRQPLRMVPDLERIAALTELLGHPELSYPSLQVTGTNGKTTTTTMVACLLGALGLRAGSYTSPHLQDVRERIRVDTELISGRDLAERVAELSPFLAEIDGRQAERLTFFEVLTALAYTHFADVPVDVGVFEVGMGGRWDATNLVRGEVAVLNTIGLDHPQLGGSVAEVAQEKAGIIKPGAVVVSAVQEQEAAEVIAEAVDRQEGQLVVAGRDFGLRSWQPAVGGQQLHLQGVTGAVDEVFLPLFGAHQAANAALALVAVEGFLGFTGIAPDVVREGFSAVRAPGRLEVVRRDAEATVILDGAHNPGGAAALAAALRGAFVFPRRVLVLGVLGDKDVEGICAALVPAVDAVVVTEPPSARAADVERVAAAVRAVGGDPAVAEDVTQALELAAELAGGDGAVVVTGSLYTVGAARDALGLAPS